jgi:hypothetical protein
MTIQRIPKNPPYTNSNYLSLELHNLYFEICALGEQTNITFLKTLLCNKMKLDPIEN